MKVLKGLLIAVAAMAVIYFVGPTPNTPVYNQNLPTIPAEPSQVEQYVKDMESKVQVKPNNEARIIWANDSLKQKTEYVVLYLHGFSASQEEGAPVHLNFASKFGSNLYLARLSEHGLVSDEPMAEMTADKLWESAVEAYAIAKQLGNKVIIMSTSTGGSLSLMLCEKFPEIHSQILLSPNIRIYDPNSKLLNDPWGKQIAKIVTGNDHIVTEDQRDIFKQYWYSRYPLDPLPELEELLETAMTEENFSKVKQPTLMLYYYKNEQEQDHVVSVEAMKEMFEQISTPAALKKEVPIPTAGNHVIGGAIVSKDIASVQNECEKFAIEVLNLPIINKK
jgi:esterase/lipase